MNPTNSAIPCPTPLPDTVLHGLECFNAGDYFEAHEFLETAWRAEKGPIRDLYRGILQVGVGYYHLQRENLTGAHKMFVRARTTLAGFSPDQCGIDLAGLLTDVDQVEAVLNKPENLRQKLGAGLLKPIRFTHQTAEEK
ncbi:MAG TPA: DUF309 domain-containing protein [Longilinea sp.]|nr:DUF309 domain-containing protein [Longilinea sp.]